MAHAPAEAHSLVTSGIVTLNSAVGGGVRRAYFQEGIMEDALSFLGHLDGPRVLSAYTGHVKRRSMAVFDARSMTETFYG